MVVTICVTAELAGLRWTDLNLEKNVILLTDESTHGRRDNDARRETKSGRSRSFPIRQELLAILQEKV